MTRLCILKPREICVPVGLIKKKAIEVGCLSLETAFIIQQNGFIVAKTYHADKEKGKYERFVPPSFWFSVRNGSPTFVNSLFDHGRLVGKFCLIYNKIGCSWSNKTQNAWVSIRRSQSKFSTVYFFASCEEKDRLVSVAAQFCERSQCRFQLRHFDKAERN